MADEGDLDMAIEVAPENPKREGTKSYTRYEKYKMAKTKGEYLELGGTRADYKYDVSTVVCPSWSPRRGATPQLGRGFIAEKTNEKLKRGRRSGSA